MEFKHPDMTASNTNPFVQIYPRTPAKRAFATISDNETYLGVARELTKLTGDKRFEDMWRFIAEKRADVYLQRIIDGSTSLRGYQIGDLEELAKRGVPALMNTRSYPRINSYEQINESKPWFTRPGGSNSTGPKSSSSRRARISQSTVNPRTRPSTIRAPFSPPRTRRSGRNALQTGRLRRTTAAT